MKNIVFLDFDGVLNTNDNYDDNLIIHKDKLLNLYNLLKLTNSNIVISSYWRFNMNLILDTINDVCFRSNFDFYFFKDRIIGSTPMLDFYNREKEILFYVKEHNIKNFIALDDNPIWDGVNNIFPSKPNWLINTNPDIGFDLIQLSKAIKLIKNNKNLIL